MVKSAEVILSHANRVGTTGGKVVAGTRTEWFMNAVKVPACVPLSGRSMSFDVSGALTTRTSMPHSVRRAAGWARRGS
jgi:hypothetical protein